MARFVYQIEVSTGEVVQLGVAKNPSVRLLTFFDEVRKRMTVGLEISDFTLRVLGSFDTVKEAKKFIKEKELIMK